MFVERDMTWDKDDLKGRIDLRDIVAEAWGPGHRSGKAVMYRARWREGDRNPSFAVYENGFEDFGGSGDSGDVYTWLEREYGLAFGDAVQWLHQRLYGAGSALPVPARRRESAATNDPPSAEWQRAAREALEQSFDYLWSDADDARHARNYLRVERGLSDDTIRAFELGYNPGWMRTRYRYWSETLGRWRRARLAPGIVIPWYRDGALAALRVRCRVGRFAQWLDVPPDSLNGREIDKYRSYFGSRLAGVLFKSDGLNPDSDLLIVEGEFDAMLAGQMLASRLPVVTLGSATNRLSRRLRDQLLAQSRVYSVMDRDSAGEEATERLSRLLGDRHTPLTLPIGKDVTEYIVERGGDFARWIADVTGPALSQTEMPV